MRRSDIFFLDVVFVSFFYLAHCSCAEHKSGLILLGDDAGFESRTFSRKHARCSSLAVMPDTKGLEFLAQRGAIFENAFTVVSSCSSSRSSILTGLPPHQNGMYGLHNDYHHFESFEKVKSLPGVLMEAGIFTGIVGKKHVAPKSVYKFDFEETEENNSGLQVGRNITVILEYVRQFLDAAANRSFLLYIGFHDPHRCGHTHPEFGSFCEHFGNGQKGMGIIPDWNPVYYDPSKVCVPYFVPDTWAARRDIAAQYTAINRMDQGIQLILKEFDKRNLLDQTLILYTSDNGIPFPSGRTNLYDPGMQEPFILSDPTVPDSWGSTNKADLVSLIDVVPTFLDWFGVAYPTYRVFHQDKPVRLTGHSLRPLLTGRLVRRKRSVVFSSHSLHEITMYYPMRVVRSRRHKLIHNLNYQSPFPIDQDFYLSETWRDLLNRTRDHRLTMWYKNITGYYYRDKWELFDLRKDPKELVNRVNDMQYKRTLKRLKGKLRRWMNFTNDPWLCSPSGVFENKGYFALQPQCLPLYNDT